MCIPTEDDFPRSRIVSGAVKIAPSDYYDYVLPKTVVVILGVVGIAFFFVGALVLLIGYSGNYYSILPWGSVVIGIGFFFIAISSFFCFHGNCIVPADHKTTRKGFFLTESKPRKKGRKRVRISTRSSGVVSTTDAIHAEDPKLMAPVFYQTPSRETSYSTSPERFDGDSRPCSEGVEHAENEFQYYKPSPNKPLLSEREHQLQQQQSTEHYQRVAHAHYSTYDNTPGFSTRIIVEPATPPFPRNNNYHQSQQSLYDNLDLN